METGGTASSLTFGSRVAPSSRQRLPTTSNALLLCRSLMLSQAVRTPCISAPEGICQTASDAWPDFQRTACVGNERLLMSSHHAEAAAVTVSSGSCRGTIGVASNVTGSCGPGSGSTAAVGDDADLNAHWIESAQRLLKVSTLFQNNIVCSIALIPRASWEPHRTPMAMLTDMGSGEYEKSRQCQAAERRPGKSHESKESPFVCLAKSYVDGPLFKNYAFSSGQFSLTFMWFRGTRQSP